MHEYDEIEPANVFEAIRSAPAHLPVYLEAVLSFVEQKKLDTVSPHRVT